MRRAGGRIQTGRRWAVITVSCLVLLTVAGLLPDRTGAEFSSSTQAATVFRAPAWPPVSSLWWAGDNQSGSAGETGLGDTVAVRASTAIDDPGTFSAVTAGYYHSCAIRSSTVGTQPPGTIVCWGRNGGGQLGRGSTFNLQATPQPITPAGTTWRALTGGNEVTCAIRSAPADGSLWCWGWGGVGQLGNGGTPLQQTTPGRVVSTGAVPATWLSLSGDGDRFCALATDGGLWCWGRNEDGELGDGSTTNRATPTPVQSTATWSAVAAGPVHTCAIAAGGAVEGVAVQPGQAYCWGRNDYRALGTGSTATTVPVPAPVQGGLTFATLTAGNRATCGITDVGRLWCWGQLGDGGASTTAPQQVGTSTGWTSIEAGGDGLTTFCGIDGGALQCRGGNIQGAAGDGTLVYRTAWGAVGNSTASTWSSVQVGRSHACALNTTSRVFCWGSAEFGQPGNGTVWFRNTVRDTGNGSGRWSSVDSEDQHTCALRDTDLYCWGKNSTGQLGIGGYTTHGTAQRVAGSWNQVTVGSDHTCALDIDGGAWCWGRNLSSSTLATPGNGNADVPTRIVATGVSGTRWTSIDSGLSATCGIRDDGTLWCWGAQSQGVLGSGSANVSLNRPAQVAGGGHDWAGIQVSSNEHACADKSDGTLYCWGNNSNGQAGTGTAGGNLSTPRRVPEPAAVSGKWVSYGVGHDHVCAVDAAGVLWCWGRNNDRQFGTPSNTADSATPVVAAAPASGTTWTSVVAGGNSTCATRSDGQFWCWGHNYRGKLGQGTDNTTVPSPGLTSSTRPASARLSRVSVFVLR